MDRCRTVPQAPDGSNYGETASGAVIVFLPMVMMMVVAMSTITGIKTEGAKKGAKKAPTEKPWHWITSFLIAYIPYY